MFELLGYKKVARKSDGVVFFELHCSSDELNVFGKRVDSFFVRADMIENIEFMELNLNIDVVFNRLGRVQRVVIKV